MKKILSMLLCLALVCSLGVCAFASGEAASSGGGGGGALPSGGSFGDVKTGIVNNAVILIEGGALTVTEDAAEVYNVAAGGEVSADSITGLYLQNTGIYNSINDATGTTQGITGVAYVDCGGTFGGAEGYYAVEENGDIFTMPTVTETTDGSGYSNVILLGDEGSVFSRESAEVGDGAALAIGGGTEDDILTVENTYLWTAGFKRTNLFADDNSVQLVVRDSRIVSPGADNYKKGWQALYGGARDTLLQNGDCWFYNSEIVTEGWGALAIDSSPNLDLYAVNCDVDTVGGGYISYTPGDGSINFYGVDASSAQYGVFVTGNSTAYMHGLDDLDEAAETYMTEADHEKLADSVTGDGRTHITADYAAYVTHQGGGNSPTTAGYLYAEHTVLSTENEYTMADNSHFLNDGFGGTSWFWTEMWRGSTCLCRSTNATFEFDNVELISRTGVIFRTVVNWEGDSKDFTLDDDTEAVGNSLLMTDMDVTGDIRNDDIYRNLYVSMTDTSVTGAMVSTTIDTWNEMFTVEALEASPAYDAALEEMASWADEIPNPTYDVEYPYADFEIDLDAVSGYLTMPEYHTCNGICLTMDEGSVWTVTGDSQLKSLALAEGAVIAGDDLTIYVNCISDGNFDISAGTQVDELTAGEYEGVVILVGGASGEASNFNDGSAEPALSGSPTTVLKGASILDSTHDGEVLDILVQDGYIVEVGEDLEGDEVIDLTGYTLMPGIIDAHVHVAGSSGYNIDLLQTWAQHGITSVRELGMLSTADEEGFIDEITAANEDPQNAYLVSCGKYLDVEGGYGGGPTGNMGIVITNADEAAAEIEHKAELGYPQVKVGINSDENRMDESEFTAIIDTAHENGMTVSAHINYAAYLEELVGYGIDEAAHTPSDEMSGELIDNMVSAGVSMNTSGSESYEEQKIANLQAFYEAGGLITTGTDLMRNYDTCMESLSAEMAVLYKAGLTVQEVITCATHNGAEVLGIADTGDILPGYQADIVAVQGDVDGTFAALNDISFVMNNGVIIAG